MKRKRKGAVGVRRNGSTGRGAVRREPIAAGEDARAIARHRGAEPGRAVPALAACVLQHQLRDHALAALDGERGHRRVRPRLTDERRGVGRHHAIGAQHRLGVRNPLRLIAGSADLVLVHEGDGRVGDVGGRLQLRIAVPERRQLVPDELELQVQRPRGFPLGVGVRQDVVVRGRVPPSPDRPLRDPPSRSAAELHRSGIHARFLVQVADDAGGLEAGESLADEEVVGGFVIGEGGAQRRRALALHLGDAAASDQHRAAKGRQHHDLDPARSTHAGTQSKSKASSRPRNSRRLGRADANSTSRM